MITMVPSKTIKNGGKEQSNLKMVKNSRDTLKMTSLRDTDNYIVRMERSKNDNLEISIFDFLIE